MKTKFIAIVVLTVAIAAILGCASNGRPFYQRGPGWEYYYDNFKPQLVPVGAANSPASGAAYDTDPEYFFWNQVNTYKLALHMTKAEVLAVAALRPDSVILGRDEHQMATEIWVYRKDCSQYLRLDEYIPRSNIRIMLYFVAGRLAAWEPTNLTPLTPEKARAMR